MRFELRRTLRTSLCYLAAATAIAVLPIGLRAAPPNDNDNSNAASDQQNDNDRGSADRNRSDRDQRDRNADNQRNRDQRDRNAANQRDRNADQDRSNDQNRRQNQAGQQQGQNNQPQGQYGQQQGQYGQQQGQNGQQQGQYGQQNQAGYQQGQESRGQWQQQPNQQQAWQQQPFQQQPYQQQTGQWQGNQPQPGWQQGQQPGQQQGYAGQQQGYTEGTQGYRSNSMQQNPAWGNQQQTGQQEWGGYHPHLGVNLGQANGNGATVISVAPQSPAAQAGLQSGDQIVAINGQQISGNEQLVGAINRANPHQPLALNVLRNGRPLQLQAVLIPAGQYPSYGMQQVQTGRFDDDEVVHYQGHERAALGITLSDSARGGVQVAHVLPYSPAAQAGLQAGDRIVAINQQPVGSYRDVTRIIGQMNPNSQVQLHVDRNGQQSTLVATLASPQQVFQGGTQQAYGPNAPGGPYDQQNRFYRGPDQQQQQQQPQQ
jgi:PDZ domain-containing protein